LFGVALREGRDHLEMKMAPRGTIKPYWGPVGGWGSARSNVQGQRTVGITEKPELAPLDRLAAQYSFEPPRMKGLDRWRPVAAFWAGR
jgi:hypothetical protein